MHDISRLNFHSMNKSSTLTVGLTHYWNFNNHVNDIIGTSGGTAYGPLTYTNSTTTTSAASFGLNSYVDLYNAPSLGSGDWTINLWFCVGTGQPYYTSHDERLIISQGLTSSEYAIELRTNSKWLGGGYYTLQAAFIPKSGTTIYAQSELISAGLVTGSGYKSDMFMCTVVKKSNVSSIYINNDLWGAVFGTLPPDTLGGPTASDTNNYGTTGQFKFGSPTGSTPYFSGLLDEVGYWNRALTSTEMAELYQVNQTYPFL